MLILWLVERLYHKTVAFTELFRTKNLTLFSMRRSMPVGWCGSRKDQNSGNPSSWSQRRTSSEVHSDKLFLGAFGAGDGGKGGGELASGGGVELSLPPTSVFFFREVLLLDILLLWTWTASIASFGIWDPGFRFS